jgi:hypothetical protein
VNSSSAVANNPVMIPVTISPPPSGGSGTQTCPGGLLVSTLDCDPLGSGGTSSYCLTSAEYMQASAAAASNSVHSWPGSCV